MKKIFVLLLFFSSALYSASEDIASQERPIYVKSRFKDPERQISKLFFSNSSITDGDQSDLERAKQFLETEQMENICVYECFVPLMDLLRQYGALIKERAIDMKARLFDIIKEKKFETKQLREISSMMSILKIACLKDAIENALKEQVVNVKRENSPSPLMQHS